MLADALKAAADAFVARFAPEEREDGRQRILRCASKASMVHALLPVLSLKAILACETAHKARFCWVASKPPPGNGCKHRSGQVPPTPQMCEFE